MTAGDPIAELWRRGILRWKLDDAQRAMLEDMERAWGLAVGGISDPANAAPRGGRMLVRRPIDDEQDINSIDVPLYFMLCHRGFGKTFLLVVIMMEICLKIRGASILYLAPEGGMDGIKMFRGVADKFVLYDCPDDIRPKYNQMTNEYEFRHNGSVIGFRGVNGEKIEKQRGLGLDLVVCDECGNMDDLRYAVLAVLASAVNRLDGHIILATTIPRTPQHESMRVYKECVESGRAKSIVLRDNARMTWRQKAKELLTAGESKEDIPAILAGTKRPIQVYTRREFFNEEISDASQMVIPEWTDAARRDLFGPYRLPEIAPGVLAPLPRGYTEDGIPAYRDCYVGMDPGFQDRTGLVFGYLDYVRQKFVVEHAEVLVRPGTQDVADAIHGVEQRLWPGDRPLLRVSDIDLRLVNDLAQEHGLEFAKAEKKGRMVDRITQIRQAIRDRRLEIRPGASLLDDQLRSAVWNSVAKDFERTAEGHSDLVAALMYLLAVVDWRRDPYPRDWWDGDLSPLQRHRVQERRRKQAGAHLGDTPFARRILAEEAAKRGR